MESSIRIGRIAGIEIGVHWSWFFIFFLLTWSLSTAVFDEDDMSGGVRWTAGTITSGVFFASVLLHELSHSLVARRRGVPVRSITLFVFGGVSNLEQEAETAKDEFLIAIVGPLMSLLLGIAFLALWATAGQVSDTLAGPTGWLGLINISLFVFNMMPGFPLDGGRVLRSVLWWNNRSHLRATELASRSGVWLAWLLIAAGIVVTFAFSLISGIWFILIGWFLRNASEASYAQSVVEDVLKGMTARDVATQEYDTVPPDLMLDQLVAEYVMRRHHRAFPVVVAEQLIGLITLTDIKQVPQAEWPASSVYRAMRHADDLHVVSPDTPLEEALTVMAQNDVNQLPVVGSYRELLGMVSRADVLRLIQVRSEVAPSRAGAAPGPRSP